MKIKKIVSTIALTSIVGASLIAPFQVLSVAAEENPTVIGPTGSYTNIPIGPNLISQDFTTINNIFKDYQISESSIITAPDSTKTPTLYNDNSWLRTNINSTQAISATNPFSFSTRDLAVTAQKIAYIATTIKTEPGKLYQFKYDTKLYNTGNFTASPQNSLIKMNARVATHTSNVTYKSNSYSLAGTSAETVTNKDEIIEFRATSDKTVISAEMSYFNLGTNSGYHFAAMNNYSVKEIDEATSQEARDRVANLFIDNEVTGTIYNNTDQVAIDDAKLLVDALLSDSVRAELQSQLNEAQTQLNARNEAITAEKTREDAAEKAVKELFTGDDPTNNTLQNTTSQQEIDDAKKLADAITNPTKKAALLDDLDKAQNLLNIQTAEKTRQDAAENGLKELFNNNNPSGTIKDTTNQEAIDTIQNLINTVTDPEKKAALQTELDNAQSQLDTQLALQNSAKTSVDNLFSNTNRTNLANDVDQADIDNVKTLVNQVTDSAIKVALEQDIAKAQALLDAKNTEIANQLTAENTVKALFDNNDSKGTIKNTTDQAAIDTAQQLVNSVTDSDKKTELQQALNKAQRQLALGEVTIDSYTTGGNYITGTTKTGVTKVGIYVNGKLIRTAAASNGTYQIYASTTPELQVAGQTFEVVPIATDGTIGLKSSSVVVAKVAPKKIAKPMIDDYFKGASYITGTVSTEAKKIALYIDGQFIRYGAITGDTFKIYASDVALMKSEGQTFEVVAVDNLGNEGERASSDVKVKNIKGSVMPNETTTLSTYNTGTVSGDVHMIALYVDGKFVRYGAVTGTDYKVYIYDVPSLRIAGNTFEVRALDTAGNVLYTSTQTVQ
ncbi:hypothetical protein HCJ39_14845 [Listeria rocourtiae]|nr:toxin Cry1Ac domain D-VI-related protein [Listeria rocourtiae]MBC1605993.1 hypothetical protein [Listeria rocourtiae]